MRNCYFCANGVKDLDYKGAEQFRKFFLGAQAKVMKRSASKLCAKHQRKMTQAVKRSRFLALLPFVEC